MFAQGKSKVNKQIPSLQKVEEVLTTNQTDKLFEEKLQTTEEDELILLSEQTDEIGFYHQKYQQYYNAIPVDGRTVTVHSRNGLIEQLSGNFKPLENIDTRPTLSKIAALQRAMNHVGALEYAWETDECVHQDAHEGHEDHRISLPEGELVVFAHPYDNNVNRLAYKYDIYATQPLSRAYIFVDATNGEILFQNDRIHGADVPGSCSTLYNGTQSITVDNSSGPYRLRQTSDGDGVQTYDMNNGTSYNNASDVTSGSTTFGSGSAIGNQAHFGAEQTHKYFMTQHNRNSYNGNGAVLRSYVSANLIGMGYNSNINAFWDGSRMTYGDGDGSSMLVGSTW
jgi:Zn-dependent metalloprotease